MGALIDQANLNPWNEGLEGYIFWATVPNKPIEANGWLRDLREVCKGIGMNDVSRITFHAWRHFFTTFMSGKVDNKILQLATGHKTLPMLEHYADHWRLKDVSILQIAQKEVFEPIIREICI